VSPKEFGGTAPDCFRVVTGLGREELTLLASTFAIANSTSTQTAIRLKTLDNSKHCARQTNAINLEHFDQD